MPNPPDRLRTVAKTLAEIALDEGLADEAVLAAAAMHADEAEEPLVVSLVREGKIGEVALVAALRRQVRVSIADPATVSLDTDALRELPRDVCRRRRVLPLAVQVHASGPRTLRLAMADPTDDMAVAEVEHLTGCQVEPALMTLSAVEELIETGYRGFVTEVMKRDRKPVYGGDPSVSTVPAAPREAATSGETKPTTTPHHRITDEATDATRLRALVQLLVDKGVVTEAEYEEAVRRLLKGRASEG